MRKEGWIQISFTSFQKGYGYVGAFNTEDFIIWRMFLFCGKPTEKWHSFCFIVDNTQLNRYNQCTSKLPEFKQTKNMHITNRQELTVAHNGKICVNSEVQEGNFKLIVKPSLVIGQTSNVLYGDLMDFNVWNRTLSHEEAKSYTNDCLSVSYDARDLLIDWSSAKISSK